LPGFYFFAQRVCTDTDVSQRHGTLMMPSCDLLTIEIRLRILKPQTQGSLRHGIQKTLGTRNLYRQILVPRCIMADAETYTKYMTGCKPIRVWTTGDDDIKD
jgi:hypothetical protein